MTKIYNVKYQQYFCMFHQQLYTLQKIMQQIIHSDNQQDNQDKKQRTIEKINNIMFMVPPAQQLPKKQYSLEPDMVNGWKPKKKKTKQTLPNIFNIKYQNQILDQIVYQLLSNNKKKKKYKISYLGQRPATSYWIHQNLRFKNPQYKNPYPSQQQLIKNYQRQFVGANPKIIYPSIVFDANFQSGNLDTVIQVNQTQYDLFMRVDTNTKGHTNWYNFIVKNKQKKGKIKFNICNFHKYKSLYQRGMKPYIFSKRLFQQLKISWRQGGQNVTYSKKRLRYVQSDPDSQQSEQNRRYPNFVLSFTYDFCYMNDQIQIAYCIPYTFTNLQNLIQQLQKLDYVQIIYKWKSLSGIPIPIIIIKQEPNMQIQRKCIMITARVHPGQTNGSILLQGFLKYLCKNQQNSRLLRRKSIFFIIPMINPDGVIAGNYRTSLFGKDLNRSFDEDQKHFFPETYYLKEYVYELKLKYKNHFDLFIDLHGHSIKKNIFIYGPEYPINENSYYECRLLPKILSSITPMFRYYSCIFKISSFKDSTARAVFNRNFKIKNCYTIQSSNGFYYNKKQNIQQCFNKLGWQNMGISLCNGINQFINMIFQKQKLSKIRLNQIQQKRKINQKDRKINKKIIDTQPNQKEYFQKVFQQQQYKISDDQISQGSSDSEPIHQDLSLDQLKELESQIFSNKKSLKYKRSNKYQIFSKSKSNIKSTPQNQKKQQSQKLMSKFEKYLQQNFKLSKPEYLRYNFQKITKKRFDSDKNKKNRSENISIQKKLPPIKVRTDIVKNQIKKKQKTQFELETQISNLNSNTISNSYIKSSNISKRAAKSIAKMILSNQNSDKKFQSLSLSKRQSQADINLALEKKNYRLGQKQRSQFKKRQNILSSIVQNKLEQISK